MYILFVCKLLVKLLRHFPSSAPNLSRCFFCSIPHQYNRGYSSIVNSVLEFSIVSVGHFSLLFLKSISVVVSRNSWISGGSFGPRLTYSPSRSKRSLLPRVVRLEVPTPLLKPTIFQIIFLVTINSCPHRTKVPRWSLLRL